ncbi:nucleoside hydrolase [Candidatus Poribacteria bacterium]|nr:nucleoside hydrolase [Candidatus Poribacteria bacterium]
MTDFPKISNDIMLKKLEPPTGKVSMVLDTDTYNEIDDQFAVVYSILSGNIDLEAIYAAPFHNSRSSGPGDGMEKSYEEIIRLLDRLDYEHDNFVFRGSKSYLPEKDQPVKSEAAEDLIKKAMEDRDQPLYVAAIGAITNVASAILMKPEIIQRIVVIWLGGQPLYWPSAREFNLGQDVPASKIMFDSSVPLIHIPCKNVSEHLRTTVPEVERYVKGKGKIGDYLHDIFVSYHKDHFAWSKVIWDISAIAWLINSRWIPSDIHPSPILTSEVTWSFDPKRHFIRIANDAKRDAVFGDLFRKLEKYAESD